MEIAVVKIILWLMILKYIKFYYWQDLFSAINMEGLVCLNEKIKDSGKNPFKHLSNKFDKSKFV